VEIAAATEAAAAAVIAVAVGAAAAVGDAAGEIKPRGKRGAIRRRLERSHADCRPAVDR
jgi:hypothetical protein